MSYKELIPRFFLYTGSILIFISIFQEREIITNIMTGDTRIVYGYDRPSIIILFFVSLVPIIMYEIRIKGAAYYLFILFIEIILFMSSISFYAAIYGVETGIGFYFTMTGGLFQLVGILTLIIIEQIKRKNALPTDRSEQVGAPQSYQVQRRGGRLEGRRRCLAFR